MLLPISEQTFKQDVLDAPMPVLVHFSAPWCGICRLIAPVLAQFQADWQGQVQVVEINADESLRLAAQYRLTTLPTLLLFRNGRLLHRLDSFRGRDGLLSALTEIIEDRAHDAVGAAGFNLTVCNDVGYDIFRKHSQFPNSLC